MGIKIDGGHFGVRGWIPTPEYINPLNDRSPGVKNDQILVFQRCFGR